MRPCRVGYAARASRDVAHIANAIADTHFNPGDSMKKQLCFTLVLLAGGAHAQEAAMREYCAATPEEKRVADATAFMVPNTAIVPDPGGATYSITNAAPMTYYENPSQPICTDDPYRGQVRAPAGRTAFLVGNDLMMSAGHAMPLDATNYKIVFGLRRERLSDGSCGSPSFTQIPSANVYGVVQEIVTGYDLPIPAGGTVADYVVFRLDRAVPGAQPLPLRRSGVPEIGDPLLVAGHTYLLPLKLGQGGTVDAINAYGIEVGFPPSLPGNSGSPIYNLRKKVVETVIGAPTTGATFVHDAGAGCWRFGPVSNGGQAFNNGLLSQMLPYVPPAPTEVQVSPLSPVHHQVLPNDSLTNATTTFTISPSPNAAGGSPQTFRVVAVGRGGKYDLKATPAGNFTVSSGDAPRTIAVEATKSNTTTCGNYASDVSVVRDDGRIVAVVPHRFDMGMSSYTLAPDGPWRVSELSAPYATRTLALSNPSPVATSLSVASNAAWLTVNGGSSATVSLAPVGTSGSTATVALAIAASAGSTIPLLQTGSATVTITPNDLACSDQPAHRIPVAFTNGVETFSGEWSAGTAFPQPTGGQTFGSVIEIPIDLSAQAPFHVADVDLDVSFVNVPGSGVALADVDTHLRAELVGPDGTTALLWDRANAPPAYVVSTPDTWGIKLDDATTPPMGPQRLAVFNGRAGKGVWKVRLFGMAGTQDIFPLDANLVIKKSAATSPMVFSAVPAFVNTLAAPAAGQTFGAPTELSIDAGTMPAFTVADVNLDVGFYNESGLFYGADLADTIVKLELVAPDNTTAVLWDRNNSTSAYVANETIYYDNGVVPMSVLKLDDATTAPLGGGLLSAFNGHAGAGTWKVRIYGAAGAGNVVPQAARLSIVRTP